MLHTVLFNKNAFSIPMAERYLKDHKIYPKAFLETPHLYRYRIVDPHKHRIISIRQVADGVQYVFAKPRDTPLQRNEKNCCF